MRPDQRARMADLSEKLADVFLDEANPDAWPGAGVPMEEWKKEIRGDRYWMKKNCAATLAVLTRMQSLLEVEAPKSGKADTEQTDLEQTIADAEREAARLIEDVMGRHSRPRAKH